MDKTTQNSGQASASAKRRMMDFAPSKLNNTSSNLTNTPSTLSGTSNKLTDASSKLANASSRTGTATPSKSTAASVTNQPQATSMNDFGKPITAFHQESHNTCAAQTAPGQTPATPVTSAKAVINARFANQTRPMSGPTMKTSAREAVNHIASSVPGSPKSAANLHHGSIQNSMNMQSVRASASALLQRSAPPAPRPPRIIESKNSYDPLAHVPSATRQSAPRTRTPQDISAPVVKTSLQLNRNTRPRQSPVILPANSAKGTKRLSSLLAAQKQRATMRPAPNPAYRGASTMRNPQAMSNPQVMRDPQMTNQRTYSEQDFARHQAIEVAKNAKMADIIDNKLGAPGRRIEPIVIEDTAKHPENSPTHEFVVAADISRIAEATIAERVPQPLEVKRINRSERLGTIENSPTHRPHRQIPTANRPTYNQATRPATAQMVENRVAPGSHNFQADNNPTYSFSRPKDQGIATDKKNKSDNKSKSLGKNRYSATEKSPFLKSVQVDKRPLSDSSVPPQPTTVNTGLTSRSERKKEVKRVKVKAKQQQQNLPSRPTVIIPASRRSRAPLVFLILLTVILGAIVGTATYFFFFNEF